MFQRNWQKNTASLHFSIHLTAELTGWLQQKCLIFFQSDVTIKVQWKRAKRPLSPWWHFYCWLENDAVSWAQFEKVAASSSVHTYLVLLPSCLFLSSGVEGGSCSKCHNLFASWVSISIIVFTLTFHWHSNFAIRSNIKNSNISRDFLNKAVFMHKSKMHRKTA